MGTRGGEETLPKGELVHKFPFFLDVNMPRLEHPHLDVVHALDESDPGAPDLMLLNRARKLKRTFVTKDKGFLKAGAVPVKHCGVIVVTPDTTSAFQLEQNLQHFQLCAHGCLEYQNLSNEVFLLEAT